MEEELIEQEVPTETEGLNIDELITTAGSGERTVDKVIEILKSGRVTDVPDIIKFKKQYEPTEHAIFDLLQRPDRKTTDKDGNNEKTVKVNRQAFPLQKRIVSSTVSFLFGNPVELNSNIKEEDADEQVVLQALKRVGYDNKIASFDRKVARDVARCTEVAEFWYAVPVKEGRKHKNYGFDSEFKIRGIIFSPWLGNKLYPFFDETGNMIAFSREFKRKDINNTENVYFEVLTENRWIIWKQAATGGNSWTRTKNVELTFGKIPVVYGAQDNVEWADVQPSIERLETLLSNFADTNDYHAAPKIYFEGPVQSVMQKGDSGGLIQGSKGTKAYYLSWAQAPEAVKLEIETLLRFIYSFTQTPDISFDSVKGLQQISGEALKMLFMDAHLKVQEKREIFDEYLQRRINIQKAMIGTINKKLETACDSLEVTPEITPFIINDQTTLINNLMTANGNKPILSQKTAVSMFAAVTDVKEELDQIQKEKEEDSITDIFEPTV